jgi:hypothetical protein
MHRIPAKTATANPNPTWKPNRNCIPEVTPMTLTITDSTMTSDRTSHTARHATDRNGWEVSWLPGQILDRNTAITAMTLADTTAEQDLHEGHRLWPHIQGWAEELNLTAADAIAQVSQPPSQISSQQEQANRQPDREAAD